MCLPVHRLCPGAALLVVLRLVFVFKVTTNFFSKRLAFESSSPLFFSRSASRHMHDFTRHISHCRVLQSCIFFASCRGQWIVLSSLFIPGRAAAVSRRWFRLAVCPGAKKHNPRQRHPSVFREDPVQGM